MSVSKASALFWSPMKSKGHEVSAGQMRLAVQKWNPRKGYSNLATMLERDDLSGTPVEYARIADRMVQKMRKAGLIEHLGGGKWKWADE